MPAESPDAELLLAYQHTSYHIPELALSIRIGDHHPTLDSLLAAHNATHWAFVSAANPFSRQLSDAENLSRHQSLLDRVATLLHWSGEGKSDDHEWPTETSLLILDISENEAIKLGRVFEQHAIVVGVIGQAATLAQCFDNNPLDQTRGLAR